MQCESCPRRGEPTCGSRIKLDSPLLVVGMSPGAAELLQGLPFVGPSGRVLAAALGQAGFSLQRAMVINVVNCLPAGGIAKTINHDGKPLRNGTRLSKEQKAACRQRFEQELRQSKAKVVLALGGEAMEAVTGVVGDITAWAGHLIKPNGQGPPSAEWILPSLHPAYIIRMGGLKLFPVLQAHCSRAARALRGEIQLVDGTGQSPAIAGFDPGPIAAFDIETIGDEICRIGFAGPGGTGSWAWSPEVQRHSRRILGQPGVVKVAHHAAFDIPRLQRAFVDVVWPWWDTMEAARLLHPDLPKSLTAVAGLLLDTPPWKHLSNESPEYYNRMDALVTYLLYKKLRDKLAGDGLLSLFEDSVMPSLRTLIELTETGLRVDLEKQERWQEKLQKQRGKEQLELNRLAGRELNVQSPKQLQKFLYEDLALPVQHNDGKPTTDVGALQALRKKAGPEALGAIEAIQKIRKTSKLLGTYMQSSPVVHPKYYPVGKDDANYGAATGRLSSQDPNIQNQPPEARIIFVPHRSRNRLVEADYDQAELWVAAALADESALLDLLGSGRHIHSENAKLFGCDKVRAKNLLYGCVPLTAQALTPTGWRIWAELRVGDAIMAYDPQANQLMWNPLQEIVHYQSAPLVQLGNKHGFSVVTTPNHRWWGWRRTGRKAHYYTAGEEFTTQEVTTEHCIRMAAPFDGAGLPSSKLPRKQDEDWVRWVLGLSATERTAFLAGVLISDGCDLKKGAFAITQKRGRFQEAMQLAMALHGYRVSVDHHSDDVVHLRAHVRPFVTGQRLVQQDAGWGPVWCPRVTTGFWLMRQGDCITITGNTLYGAGPKKLVDVLAAHGVASTQRECRALQERLAATYPKLWAWRSAVVAQAAITGHVQNAFGRRRYFSDVEGSKPEIVNFYPQSTVADIVLAVLPGIAEAARNAGGQMLTTVHDSVLVEVPRWREFMPVLSRLMTREFPQIRPGFSLPVSIKVGRRWGRMHKVGTAERTMHRD